MEKSYPLDSSVVMPKKQGGGERDSTNAINWNLVKFVFKLKLHENFLESFLVVESCTTDHHAKG